MKIGLSGFLSATLLAATIAVAGCSSTSGGSGGGAGAGGSASGGGSGGAGGRSSSTSAGGSGGSSGLGGKSSSAGGADGGSSGGSSVTTLDGSKPIGTLTSSEAGQLCSDIYAYYGQTISQANLCKWAGLSYGVSSSAPSDSQLQTNCKSQETPCLTAGPAAANCSAIPSSCTVTVSQYAACIADEAAAFNSAVGALPDCPTVKLTDLAGVWAYATGDAPASCTAITDSKCPTLDIPTPHAGTGSSGSTGGSGGTSGTGGAGGSSGGSGGTSAKGGAGGSAGGSGGTAVTGGSVGSSAGGASGSSGSTAASGLPGDVAKAAGTPFVAAHAMTRTLFVGYTGPLFKALRVSDQQEKDIGIVASTGLADLATLTTFCSGTSCKVTTLYDQSGNGNDMWRADDPNTNQPGTKKPCDLMDIDYWQMSDGTKVPIAIETGAMWKSPAQCLRNRDKTKNMPTGSKSQTEYAIFHAKWVNANCCFNYGNTNNAIAYSGPGTLTSLNFSQITFWSKGTGNGPWPMVDFETGVYAGNTGKCGSGIPSGVDCTSSGENPNPSVTFDIVTTLFKHNGVDHWALKTGNAKSGALSVNIDLPALPKGYSPLKQLGGLGLGEGGAGDSNGTGGFSEGAVMAGETSNATDDAIQKSIVSVYGK